PTPHSPPLSLHDALPIFRLLLLTGRPTKGARSKRSGRRAPERARARTRTTGRAFMISPSRVAGPSDPLTLRDLDVHDRRGDGLRSEEHTSELQSRENLVC